MANNHGGKREGSGKKRLSPEVLLQSKSIALSPKAWRWIDKEAARLNISRSAVIRKAVEQYGDF